MTSHSAPSLTCDATLLIFLHASPSVGRSADLLEIFYSFCATLFQRADTMGGRQ